MSRTDAHRPRHVWVEDHPELALEVHDHRSGPCDLPGRGEGEGRCSRELDWSIRTCSCAMCSGRAERTHARGSRRSSERALLRAAARGADDPELEELEGRIRSERAW